MILEQCVYGRVSKGLRGTGGYQTAAASPGVAGRRDILDNVRELSFQPPPGRRGTLRPRYGFASAGKDVLTFFRTCHAKDLSGSVGYFAHHLIANVRDIFDAGFLPVFLLATHPFFETETDLPENRKLPTVDIDPKVAESVEGEMRDAAFAIADALVRAEKMRVSALISQDLDDRSVLTAIEQALFLIPLPMAAKSFYCANFADSPDNVSCFRLVTVPDRDSLPEPEDLFSPFSAAQNTQDRSYSEYISGLKKLAAPPAQVRDYLAKCEGCGGFSENARLEVLAAENQIARKLPQLLETQWPGWCKERLLDFPKLFAAYFGRVPEWDVSQERESFENDPVKLANALIEIPGEETATTLLEWIAEGLLRKGPESKRLRDWVQNSDRTKKLASLASQLPLPDAIAIADAMIDAAQYDDSLHRTLSEMVFRDFPSYAQNNAVLNWFAKPEVVRRGGEEAMLVSALRSLCNRGVLPENFAQDSVSSNNADGLLRHLVHLHRQKDWPDTAILEKLLQAMPVHLKFDLILSAANRKNLSELIGMAEKELSLSESQRDSLVEIVERMKHREAARFWLELGKGTQNATGPGTRYSGKGELDPNAWQWISILGNGADGLTEMQRKRLGKVSKAGLGGFFKKLTGSN